jgi:aquaporin Z
MEQSTQKNTLLFSAFQRHWPEYLMEGAELGLFMLSACLFVALLEYPASLVHQLLPNPTLRRILIGLAMGVTAILIIYSSIGQRSGAHFNPSVTLTFWRLGKVETWDAVFYAVFQFLGGTIGILISTLLLGTVIADSTVNYAVTVPGPDGVVVAFAAEALIAFLQLSMVLRVSNTKNLARYTGVFAGVLVATYISIEAPYSGMSMNPARTFASAFPAQLWTAWWIYFTAPPLGMLLAAEVYLRQHSAHKVFCAKLHHHNDKRCIFRCNWDALGAGD